MHKNKKQLIEILQICVIHCMKDCAKTSELIELTDEDEGICYITYKCQGCNYFCR